jgi:hypothetical protein
VLIGTRFSTLAVLNKFPTKTTQTLRHVLVALAVSVVVNAVRRKERTPILRVLSAHAEILLADYVAVSH